MKKYGVGLNVIIDIVVEAENKEEAVDKALTNFYNMKLKNITPINNLENEYIEEIEKNT